MQTEAGDPTNLGFSPLCPAPSIGDEVGKKRVGLSERSEFRHALISSPTRRIKRGTGVFFWLIFFHAQENEHLNIDYVGA
jgi:hypothetical protein